MDSGSKIGVYYIDNTNLYLTFIIKNFILRCQKI